MHQKTASQDQRQAEVAAVQQMPPHQQVAVTAMCPMTPTLRPRSGLEAPEAPLLHEDNPILALSRVLFLCSAHLAGPFAQLVPLISPGHLWSLWLCKHVCSNSSSSSISRGYNTTSMLTRLPGFYADALPLALHADAPPLASMLTRLPGPLC